MTSKKDLNVSFLSRPTMEFQDHHGCQTAPSEDGKLQEKEQKQEVEGKGEIGLPSLEIVKRYSSLGEFKEEEEDGFRTPTSLDHRIPLIPQYCPPAPRKPKSVPLMGKRKAAAAGMPILLDLSNEIESLFPPALLGGKMKKARILHGSDY